VAALGEVGLTSAWVRRWSEDPGRTVVSDGGAWVTGSEMVDRTAQVAGRLHAVGLEPGDRLLLSATSSVELVVAHVAALRLGLVVVPLNPAYRQREVGHVVADAAPTVAVVDDPERGRWIAEASTSSPVLVVGPDVSIPEGPTGGLDTTALDTTALDTTPLDDVALLLYTSGTTAAPKGVPLTHRNLAAGAEAVAMAWRWTPEDRLVLGLPLFHLHGLGVGLHGTFTAGASVVLRPSFEVDDVLDAAARYRASLFFGVPTMYGRLATSARVGELAALRLCVSGSAPLPPAMHQRIAGAGGQLVLERYGMTETMMLTSNPYVGERRPSTVGFALPGVELRLDAATDEIVVRGPNVFAGYRHHPEADGDPPVGDPSPGGWFPTGDVGAFDADGYLSIVGRRKDLIISGGYNVYPREVEDVLRRHPGVGDVAVVGVADPVWGEAVVAFVEGGEAGADLMSAVADELASYKRPKRIHHVDALPRNALGKVVRAQLFEP